MSKSFLPPAGGTGVPGTPENVYAVLTALPKGRQGGRFTAEFNRGESTTALAAMDVLEFGKEPLGGIAAPGKKMTGIVAYEVKQDWSELELYLTPRFWPDREIIFTCTNA